MPRNSGNVSCGQHCCAGGATATTVVAPAWAVVGGAGVGGAGGVGGAVEAQPANSPAASNSINLPHRVVMPSNDSLLASGSFRAVRSLNFRAIV